MVASLVLLASTPLTTITHVRTVKRVSTVRMPLLRAILVSQDHIQTREALYALCVIQVPFLVRVLHRAISVTPASTPRTWECQHV